MSGDENFLIKKFLENFLWKILENFLWKILENFPMENSGNFLKENSWKFPTEISWSVSYKVFSPCTTHNSQAFPSAQSQSQCRKNRHWRIIERRFAKWKRYTTEKVHSIEEEKTRWESQRNTRSRDNISSSIVKIENGMNYLGDRRAFVCDVFCTLCIYLLEKILSFIFSLLSLLSSFVTINSKILYCIMLKKEEELSIQFNKGWKLKKIRGLLKPQSLHYIDQLLKIFLTSSWRGFPPLQTFLPLFFNSAIKRKTDKNAAMNCWCNRDGGRNWKISHQP